MQSISTYGLYNTIQQISNRVQTNLATATIQESSGLVGTSYGDYGSKSRQMLDLQAEISRGQTASDESATAGDRVQAMYSAVGNMVTEMTTLRTQLSSALSSTDNSTLNATAKGVQDDLVSQMNTQLSGRYLFSGSSADTAPVDVTGYPTTSPPTATTTDTSYYQGNSNLASVRTSSQQSITYGVTANNSAFEQAMRATQMVVQATTSPTDTATIQAAYDLAGKALTALSNVQQDLSVSANRLTSVQTTQADSVSLAQTMVGDIKNVDAAQASAQMTSYKTQLQASYSAMAAILKLKLTDYL
jgi:flagellar hook-associated protein 3 FlgL